ncbi:MAG: SET domain-containing protein-lysine N-methyltransferase [Candidatus Obscuribacterales bacterium]|nr:SET domain-containing protein-lysine N-methyltransferase [Steroidobacteraceae bacterium]
MKKQQRSKSKSSRTLVTKKALLKGPQEAPIVVRNSPIHGKGVYALRNIKKGERIVEYVGDRISHAEADRRYMDKGDDDGHTFLFIATNRTVIDGTVNGNDARFINHSCEPNCESVIDNKRVYVEATRNIKAGAELGYDYQLTWESTDDPTDLANYVCYCGAKRCRSTMLDREPLDLIKKKQKLAASKRAARKKKSLRKKSHAKAK